ncbi:hypothetical protein U9M48_030016 [Paspalum notatum var. saurae]|uniref:Fe2OG dioxygenase domain-containing protein n=1 Tax=Paspalum notatum var. saurae TaxID=547442 RepID=A0AAQ3X2V6_PASNO
MADDQPWKISPNVQELAAAGVQETPSRYVISEQDRPSLDAASMPEPIPIVDLSQLSAAAADGAGLLSALQNWGLLLIRNKLSLSPLSRAVGHGVEPGFLAEVMEVTRGFFKLPPEEKQKNSKLVNGKEFSAPPSAGRSPASCSPASPGCWACTSAPDRVFGLKPHSDASVITVVLVDDAVAGLQVQKPDGGGVWYDVPIVPNVLLVNVGDAIELTSTKKGDMTLATYSRKMKNLAETLAAIGKPIDDEEFIAYQMCRLSTEYAMP